MRFLLFDAPTLSSRLWRVGSVGFFSLWGLAAAGQATPQTTSEVGGGLGGLNYRGEVAPRYRFLNNRLAGTLFYKRDLSEALTMRGGLTLGNVRAMDADVRRGDALQPIAASRQAEMQGFLAEVLVGAEYNFLEYYDFKRRTRWTPYFFTGVAGYYTNTTTSYRIGDGLERTSEGGTKISVALPLGLGIKYALSREINLIVEAGGRRTFGDRFDNLADSQPPQLADPGGPDWYFYNGVGISYTFYQLHCPAGHPGVRRR
jgi:opacity protein-like surface antigen